MPDSITATGGQARKPHEMGQFAALCVDLVDLGQRLEQYPGKPARVVPKCALVFVTNASGEIKDVSIEFTVSMGKKAALRAFLESWRGKSYTPEQAMAGVPLHKLVGQAALISVEHKTSASDNQYAKIKSVAPLPKEITAPPANGYARPDFWVERKKEYAAEAAKWMQAQAATVAKNDDHDLPPEPEDEDDDLPF